MSGLLGSWLVPIIVGFAVTTSVLWLLLTRLGQLALDTPNHRSLHEAPVPRTGGWAVIAGVAVGLLVGPLSISPPIGLAFIALFSISLFDDLRPLNARSRFAVHSLSVMLVLYGLSPELAHFLLWIPLIIGGIWTINLYNFMDGMDGFAGSMTAIGFAALGLISFWNGAFELAGVCWLLASCSAAFLYYNWPQARIFLGDAGSTILGLSAFAIGLSGWQQGAFHWVAPLLIFCPFWLDATATLILRVVRGERWWEAHRQHVYQKMALKYGVKTSLFIELVVMLGTSLLTVFLVISGLL
ncbi:glycosyltransferase family 4 protein [Microbulbifer salipaludis]|uniref:Glycosyltransferase family 4 protein n=1 Tax=Microbulbifer salipaludis TaxID=187980 RepID=A0ABS3E7I3_9GAMM|nr:glycosyltransferase family 4 protein [Microbulbifer salipaludis]MBN8431262.1 glycosyltransferase family 4 protein [Microbulbifer salipaludis]